MISRAGLSDIEPLPVTTVTDAGDPGETDDGTVNVTAVSLQLSICSAVCPEPPQFEPLSLNST